MKNQRTVDSMGHTDAKTHSNWELMKVFAPYFKKYKKIFFLDLFAAGLTTVCELALPMILSHITDTATQQAALLTVSYIGKLSLLYIILRVIEITAQYYMQSIGHIMGVYIESDLRKDVFSHIQTLSHSFFSNTKVGHIMSRITTDLFDITEFSHHCPEEFFIGGIKLVVSFIVLVQVDWLLTLIVFSMLPLMFLFTKKHRMMMRKNQKAEKIQIGEINSKIEDSFLGVQVIKSFANEDIEEEKFDQGNNDFVNIKKRFYYSMAGFFTITRAFDGLMHALVIFVGGIFLVHGRISAGNFVAFLLYVQTLLNTINRIVTFTEQFERGMTGIERFHELMQIPQEIADLPNATVLDEVKGHIVFDDVSFRYTPQDDWVLKDLDLEIKPGDKIAIVGPSGGGKTTLSNLIPRFYEPTKGTIYLDGHDIRTVTLKSLRENIGMVQQDVYLFGGSVYENIEYGKPGASKEEIREAARLAGALGFIEELPYGFDTYIGERGVMLSGGQRQRISIARVFLKNPPVLILDEATSALDNKSEKLVQESLEELSKGRTVITIAHRLSTIQNADTILVLTDDGIVERGNHAELMDREGIYYSLYRTIENQSIGE